MKRFWIILTLFTLFLSACSPEKATVSQPVSRPTSSASQSETPAYPGPGTQSGNYPAPGYPGPDYPAPGYPEPGYPAPETYSTPEGYPAPEIPSGTPTPTVTPDATMGAVSGILLRNNKPPASEIILYLAEIIKDAKGNDRLASFSPVDSPSTTTDAQGNFRFANIKPGKYQLVLYTVINAYFLYYPGEKKEIIVTIEPAKTVELGSLNYDTLPIPEN
jgi:hypothetical protein